MEEVRFQCRHVSCWSGKPAANSGIWTIYIHLPGTKRSFPLPKSDPLMVFFCGSRLLFRLKNSPSEEMFQPTLQDQAGVQPVWQDALMFDDDDVQSDFVGKQRRKTLWRTSINSSIPKLKRFKTWSIFQRLHPSASRLLQTSSEWPVHRRNKVWHVGWWTFVPKICPWFSSAPWASKGEMGSSHWKKVGVNWHKTDLMNKKC